MVSTTKQRFIPTNSQPLKIKGVTAVVYVYEDNGNPCAVGYSGNKKTWDFKYSFLSSIERDDYANTYLVNLLHRLQSKQRYIHDHLKGDDSLAVGDVLVSTGCGIDGLPVCYEVVNIRGGNTFNARCIAIEKQILDGCSASIFPLLGSFIGGPISLRAAKGKNYHAKISGKIARFLRWDGNAISVISEGDAT